MYKNRRLSRYMTCSTSIKRMWVTGWERQGQCQGGVWSTGAWGYSDQTVTLSGKRWLWNGDGWGRHHLNQVIKLCITNDGANGHVPPGDTQWQEHNIYLLLLPKISWFKSWTNPDSAEFWKIPRVLFKKMSKSFLRGLLQMKRDEIWQLNTV